MDFLKKGIALLRETAVSYGRDNGSMLAASLSYFTIFAIAPLLVIAVAVAGVILGPTAARGQIVGSIDNAVGQEAAVLIEELIVSASRSDATIWATIVSTLLLLYGASGLFAQLQRALNAIWGIPTPPNQKIVTLIRKRAMTFGMVLLVGVLLLLSIISSTLLTALGDSLSFWLPTLGPLLPELEIVVSSAIMTVLFALLFKVLPDARIAWRDVFWGALVTAVLFTIGKFLISYYLSFRSSNATYQAAGSIVVLLIWIFYSAQILLFGAEFTQVFANTYGSKVRSHAQRPSGHQPVRPAAPPSPAPLEIPTRSEVHPSATAVSPQTNWRRQAATGLLGLAFGLLLAFLHSLRSRKT